MHLLRGPGLIVIAALLWGLDGILRRSLGGVSPLIVILIEHAIGLVLLLPFFLPSFRKERFTGREWGALAFVAVLSGLFGTLWFTTALLRTSFIPFSVVFLIQKIQPAFAALGGVLILRERVDRRYIVWGLLGILAAYFTTFPGGVVNLSTGRGTVIAALFAAGAAVAWGFSTPFSRYVLLHHPPRIVAGWRFILTIFAALLLLAGLGGLREVPALTSGHYLTLLGIALSTGMVALWIYYRGLRHTEARISAILELASPLAAILIDILLYQTVLHWSQYLAAAVLLFTTWRIAQENAAP